MTEERRLGSKAAARYLDIAWVTWRSQISRGIAPPADGYDEDFDADYWLMTTLDEFRANRPGRGFRTDLK